MEQRGVFFSGPNSYLFWIVWIILGGPGNVFDTTYMDEMNGCRFPNPVFFNIILGIVMRTFI